MSEYGAMLEAIRALVMACSWVIAAWAVMWFASAAAIFYAAWKMGRDR